MTDVNQVITMVVLMVVLVLLGIVCWQIIKLNKGGAHTSKGPASLTEESVDNVEHFFNEEFREELRNRGRLHFEKTINDNAAFLKNDLNATVAQLNEYLKSEIAKHLNEEFALYVKSMKDAQQLAIDSLNQSANELKQQHVSIVESLQTSVSERETKLIALYEQNMASIVEHYLLTALGDQFDISAQIPNIIAQMEANKQAIVEDMKL